MTECEYDVIHCDVCGGTYDAPHQPAKPVLDDGWQQYATDLSDTLRAIGHHAIGMHQSPQEYDAESGLACASPYCLKEFIALCTGRGL